MYAVDISLRIHLHLIFCFLAICSWHVMKNPVFQNPDLVEGADSGISIESDEHLAVNKAALEFDEDSDES